MNGDIQSSEIKGDALLYHNVQHAVDDYIALKFKAGNAVDFEAWMEAGKRMGLAYMEYRVREAQEGGHSIPALFTQGIESPNIKNDVELFLYREGLDAAIQLLAGKGSVVDDAREKTVAQIQKITD